MLGKWLSMRPKVMILDEPTRGIDVGAKAEIYAIMRELADAGVAILMISSDMEEVIGVSDRIAVMHEGQISGFLDRDGVLRTQRPDASRRANEPKEALPLMLKKELGSGPADPGHRRRHGSDQPAVHLPGQSDEPRQPDRPVRPVRDRRRVW